MKLRHISGFCLWLATYGACAHDSEEIPGLSAKKKLLSLPTPFTLYNNDRSLEFKVLAYRPNRENIALVEMTLPAG